VVQGDCCPSRHVADDDDQYTAEVFEQIFVTDLNPVSFTRLEFGKNAATVNVWHSGRRQGANSNFWPLKIVFLLKRFRPKIQNLLQKIMENIGDEIKM